MCRERVADIWVSKLFHYLNQCCYIQLDPWEQVSATMSSRCVDCYLKIINRLKIASADWWPFSLGLTALIKHLTAKDYFPTIDGKCEFVTVKMLVYFGTISFTGNILCSTSTYNRAWNIISLTDLHITVKSISWFWRVCILTWIWIWM